MHLRNGRSSYLNIVKTPVEAHLVHKEVSANKRSHTEKETNMSMIDAASTGFSLKFDFGIHALRAALAERRRKRDAYLRVYRELESMNDNDLADLRMSRADFHYLANQAALKA